MAIWTQIVSVLEEIGSCALVTVASVKGSTPRDEGARMVVRPDGSFFGTIGGGTLEFQAIDHACKAILKNQKGVSLHTFALGPDLGQCCGGRADIAIEILSKSQLENARMLAGIECQQDVFSTRAQYASGQALERHGAPVGSVAFELDCDNVLSETFGQIRRPLYLFGAGHVGRAVVLALAPLPFTVNWIDSRQEMFPQAVPGNVQPYHHPQPAKILEDAPEGAFVLVMTHCHTLDEDIVAQALKCGRFPYVGVIGSNTKRNRFKKRLTQRGLDETAVSQLVCPVGCGLVHSKHPAAIAAGIVVELLEKDEILQ